MSSVVAVAYFYHFLVHVATGRVITINILNRSAALLNMRSYRLVSFLGLYRSSAPALALADIRPFFY